MFKFYLLGFLCLTCVFTLVQTQLAEEVDQPSNANNQGVRSSTVSRRVPDGRGGDVAVFVNVHTHPKTGFTCTDKKAGQYYADPGTNCAVYYICLADQFGRLSPTSFACPNGTIFNQATKVCSNHDQVSCGLATRYYDSYRGHIDSQGTDPNQYSAHYETIPRRESVQPRARPVAAATPVAPSVSPVITSNRNQGNRGNNFADVNRFSSSSSSSSANSNLPPQAQPVSPLRYSQPTRRGQFRPSLSEAPIRSAAPVAPVAPKTTTTTTTTTPQPLPVEYVYDYDYDPNNPNNPNNPAFQGAGVGGGAAQGSPLLPSQPNQPIAPLSPLSLPVPAPSSLPSIGRNKRSAEVEETGVDVDRRSRRKSALELNSESGSVERLKPSNFTCHGKVSGIAYADIANDCKMFHVCLPETKGKLSDYQLFCDKGLGFNQLKATCQPLGKFDCSKSDKYYPVDKSIDHEGYRKNNWRVNKKLRSPTKNNNNDNKKAIK